MVDKTMLVMPGKRVAVPRPVKRAVTVSLAVALTAGLALACAVGNGMLISKLSTGQAISLWFGFIKRPDILATMVLTAFVTVMTVYWQRDQERRKP